MEQCKRSLTGRKTSSFRLRCPSLNSLRLQRIFDVFDKNHDGMITADELSLALRSLGLDADPSELDAMVSPYIWPGNAGLRFEDFEALHRSLNDLFFGLDDRDHEERDCEEESELTEAFKVFDEDGDGYISARELQAVLRKLGLGDEGREIDRVEKMISSVDRDHDGRVDFFEFKDMMRGVIVRSA
ncbi:hypothetical protein RJ639_046614 [Escallonia herrerae]|uniref:EF-hand domain-containing protein n=1 Tax=Escallonia herrerae TaxID=1293975 RepID=A0AA89AZA5_9ASTE|nr:hypothetical protein RJ639_046614 [Escallonia herrerae]